MGSNTTSTISTRFLIISDTHHLGRPSWITHNEDDDVGDPSAPLEPPVPKADVVLHCGDLTVFGGLDAYKDSLRMLGTIDAELKLVIAGNHDRSLDGEYWRKNLHSDEDPNEHSQAIRIMTGPLAAAAGVTYLVEGTRTFQLRNGAIFTIYTSPYQPEFSKWAFMYKRTEDRWNPEDQVADGVTPIARHPIPDFPAVDIVMTHGPPHGVLDECPAGHVGCESLLQAIRRAKLLLHCFGHIHEGYGASIITWNGSGYGTGGEESRKQVESQYPLATECHVKFAQETLMVNAAIERPHDDDDGDGYNVPWLIDLPLPKGNPAAGER